MLSVPPGPNAVVNTTYADALIQASGLQHGVIVILTDLSGKPGQGSCFNQLLHGDYVEDLIDFVHYVLNPIYGGNWTGTGVVKNATDTSIAPVDCMQITAKVYTGPASL